MLNKQQLGKKIKELREEKKMSQQELAGVIGFSRAAISEVERGNRQLSALELSKFAAYFNFSVDDLFNPMTVVQDKKARSAHLNKNLKFNAEKLRQLILYVLEKCGGKPNFGETVLYKLLYFIDFDSFENLGKPITGMNYIKLQFGPVPQAKQFSPVIIAMKEKNEIKTFVQDYHNKKQKRYIALIDSCLKDFSAQEKDSIDEVISRLSNMSASQIEAYSHGDAPWKITAPQSIIFYDLVVDREPPYTKKDYWQMWQDAAAVDTLKYLGPISKEETDYYMNI
jgi:transcriptional regulator with XRE-family HTH domain